MPDLQNRVIALAPTKGLWDDIDPALPDELYPPNASPDLENVRPSNFQIKTRLGFAAGSNIATTGSGAPRLLFTHYTAAGARYRLNARGNTTAAVLYDLLVGTDTTFQSISGATGLGNSSGDLFRALSHAERVYLTDRQNILKVYLPSDRSFRSVTQPTAPSSGPTVKARTFAILESFTGAAPFGWTETDNTNFNLNTPGASISLPKAGTFELSTITLKRIAMTTSALEDIISKDVNLEPTPSKTIAFWYEQTIRTPHVVFEIGNGGPGEFSYPIIPPKANTAYPMFIPIGSISTINYKQFRCIKTPTATRTLYLGKMILPGNLQGMYRWCYTHYASTTGRESKPDSGYKSRQFSDFAKLGVSNVVASATGQGGAMAKSAGLYFDSDAGADATTTQIRIYRNGGIAELTRDSRGQQVWIRVATILDLSTTIAAAITAADVKIQLASIGNAAGNLTAGDWVVFEQGTIAKEEFNRIIDNESFTDLVIDAVTNTKLTSVLRPFTSADVGKMVTISSGTGFTPGDYSITAVAAAAATMHAAVGTVGSTGGVGTLKGVNTVSADATRYRTIHLKYGFTFAHDSGQDCSMAYVDNNADEALDTTLRLEAERDDPPTGVKCLSRSPQGRLVLLGWTARRMGVAFSNRPTPDHALDHEVFPDAVDPITRGSLTQGFRIDLAGDAQGDEIMWGDYFRGILTILTRRGMYRVHAGSQNEWGEGVVERVLDIGCLCHDTPLIVEGTLYWVAPGPRVMAWDGQQVRDISHQRVSAAMGAAPTGYENKWWSQGRSNQDGAYYHLWMVPSGATTPTKRLDYNLTTDAWEPTIYYDSGAAAIAFSCGEVWRGASDNNELMGVLTTGATIYQHETGLTDAGQVIRVRWKTKRWRLPMVCRLTSLFLRGAAVTDTAAIAVTTGGSQYGDVTNNLTSISLSGSGDKENRKAIPFNQKGRWVDFLTTGSFSNRATLRELVGNYEPIRDERVL